MQDTKPNVEDVRDALLLQFQKLETGKADLDQCKVMNHTVQNIMQTVKSQLYQNKFLENKEPIEFLVAKKKS